MTPRGGWRPRAGRRKELRDSRVVSVLMDASTLAKLRAWCDRLGLTRSEVVRYLIRTAPEPEKPTTEEKP